MDNHQFQYTNEIVQNQNSQIQNKQAQSTQRQKIFDQNLNSCKRPKLNVWTPTNSKLWKVINPVSVKLKFLSPNEMPMKLNNYYKKRPF